MQYTVSVHDLQEQVISQDFWLGGGGGETICVSVKCGILASLFISLNFLRGGGGGGGR